MPAPSTDLRFSASGSGDEIKLPSSWKGRSLVFGLAANKPSKAFCWLWLVSRNDGLVFSGFLKGMVKSSGGLGGGSSGALLVSDFAVAVGTL